MAKKATKENTNTYRTFVSQIKDLESSKKKALEWIEEHGDMNEEEFKAYNDGIDEEIQKVREKLSRYLASVSGYPV